MYPHSSWQEALASLPPLTYEDVISFSHRWERQLNVMGAHGFNMHAPQHFLANLLFHRELSAPQVCQACQYGYGGHAESIAVARATLEGGS